MIKQIDRKTVQYLPGQVAGMLRKVASEDYEHNNEEGTLPRDQLTPEIWGLTGTIVDKVREHARIKRDPFLLDAHSMYEEITKYLQGDEIPNGDQFQQQFTLNLKTAAAVAGYHGERFMDYFSNVAQGHKQIGEDFEKIFGDYEEPVKSNRLADAKLLKIFKFPQRNRQEVPLRKSRVAAGD